MTAPNKRHLQTRLAALLVGDDSYEEFWGWLRTLQRSVPASDPARDLVLRIVARLYEYDDGVMTDEQLFAHLLGLLPPDLRARVEAHRDRSDREQLTIEVAPPLERPLLAGARSSGVRVTIGSSTTTRLTPAAERGVMRVPVGRWPEVRRPPALGSVDENC